MALSQNPYQNVVIVGTGGIGTRVAQQISETQGLSGGHSHPSLLIGLVNSTDMFVPKNSRLVSLIVDGSLSKEDLKQLMSNDGKQRAETGGYNDVLEYLQIQGWDMRDIVMVDTTADKRSESVDFHANILKAGGKIVTANKNPLSLFSLEQFQELTRERSAYRYSSSVMAGAPGINALQDAYDTRNPVLGIEGCFSGTLGFLASGIETRKLSVVLQDAIDQGFTEPNPWDDLNGLDVARKILILARTAGFVVDMKDIQISPFLPPEFAQYPKEVLVGAVGAMLDTEWEARMKQLLEAGKTLRYIAKMTVDNYGRPTIVVGLQEVEKTSSLGSLVGTRNKIAITTKNIGEQTFEQAGAGTNVTAQGIINDLRALLPETTA